MPEKDYTKIRSSKNNYEYVDFYEIRIGQVF